MKESMVENEAAGVNTKKIKYGISCRLEIVSQYFGSLFAFLFIIQAVTGILLGLYYKSYPQLAFESVLHINGQVAMGWFVKSFHFYTSYFVAASIVIFLISFLFSGAFRGERKILWYSGWIFLIATLGFLITAQLLAWDELSFYSTVRSLELVSLGIPFGKEISFFLMGGEKLSGVSLARFHAIHVSLLPVTCLLVIILVCLRLSRENKSEAEDHKVAVDYRFFKDSNFTRKFILLAGISISAITILSTSIPWSPGIRMDEMLSQPQISAPGWFLYFAAGALKIFSPFVSKLIFATAIASMIAAPFISSRSKNPGITRMFIAAGLAIFLAILIFSLIGVIQ